MKIKSTNIKVSDVVSKYKHKIFVPTEFQRQADAWTTKTKQELIISILQNSYIPPLLFSHDRIIDGLQRIHTLYEFIIEQNFRIKSFWCSENKETKAKYDDLDSKYKSKLLDYELLKIDLCNDNGNCLTDVEEKELFCKINTTSSKLNKAELIFTSCNQENREMILKITDKNEDLIWLSQEKKLKRFSLPLLILWCLTVVYYQETGYFTNTSKQSIRNNMKKFIDLSFPNKLREEFINKSLKTIKLMHSLLEAKSVMIQPGKFKVIFSALFVVLYKNLDSYNAILTKKDEISSKALQTAFHEIAQKQQIGGIHYDSYYFFKDRIATINDVFKDYFVDSKRFLPIKEKIRVYYENVNKNGGCVTCCKCGKVITKWSDINIDHIFAHTNGGKSNIENSQILCEKCNKKKGKN